MKKVLIVEDQRMPRENMERILLDSGKYKLCASVNGADVALAVCRREKIDLILMDVCTAGNKDGIEAAAEIKAEFPDITTGCRFSQDTYIKQTRLTVTLQCCRCFCHLHQRGDSLLHSGSS